MIEVGRWRSTHSTQQHGNPTGQHSTDVVKDKALAQIKAGHASGKPFFLEIAPIAPHDSVAVRVSCACVLSYVVGCARRCVLARVRHLL